MATKIVTKNSSTASAVPTASDLVQGELAVNVADKRLFTEDNAGAIVELGTNPYNFTANHNGSAKLATTSTGIDVTGTATMDVLDASGTGVHDLQRSHPTTTASLAVLDLKAKSTGDMAAGFGAAARFIIEDTANVENVVAEIAARRESSDLTAALTFTTLVKERMRIASNGDISFYEDTGTTPKFFWDASAESLGIGTSSPAAKAHIVGAANAIALKVTNAAVDGNNADVMHIEPSNGAYVGKLLRIQSGRSDFSDSLLFLNTTTGMNGTNGSYMRVQNNLGADVFRIKGDGNVGIGTSSPATGLHLSGANNVSSSLTLTNTAPNPDNTWTFVPQYNSLDLAVLNNGTERMRISSGNLLVAGTNTNPVGNNVVGHALSSDGRVQHSITGNTVMKTNQTTDGDIVQFRKGGAPVGSIGTVDGFPYISSNSNVGLKFLSSRIRPVNSDGSDRDDAIDLGASSARFDDIYATNGTIQTSDRNEKQDIEVLSEAEQRVAVAAKGLLRKFRWKDSVAEKGDDARIHFGIIAQDLQDAFAAEGLDAGDYAMFISTTWTDEETNEEKTRMGVRYSELLAFIISAL